MVRAIRLPALLDLVLVDDPEAILALAREPRLDRAYEPIGPLLNRIVVNRIRRTLQVNGTPLPTVAARGGERPTPQQRELEARLDALPPGAPCGETHLQALSAHVRGLAEERLLGPLVQEAVGRLFRPDYRGDAESWNAARQLDAAVTSNNPLRRLAWRVTDRTGRARQELADRVDGDAAALHATGIAVHNLVRAFERMRALAERPGELRRLETSEAVALCLTAPETLIYQATGAGSTAGASYRAGTLVLFRLERARARTLRADIAFMSGNWSRCPANGWVPRLLAAVWHRAASDHGGTD
ncbi:MAG: hypothetical protein WD270_06500 [Acetobacterales bacterium]